MRYPRPPSPWAVLLVTLVVVGVLAVLLVGYVHRQQQQICGIVTIIDDRNQAMPPSVDPDTTAFRRELHTYRVRLGC